MSSIAFDVTATSNRINMCLSRKSYNNKLISTALYQRKHVAGFVFEFVKEMLPDFQEELQTSAFYITIT